jgi:hypothetical protein
MRRNDLKIEQEATTIVCAEEVANGWPPGPPLSKSREREEGCDFLSTPPNGGEPHPVEVKGWGESLFLSDGRFRDRQDINRSSSRVHRAIPTGVLKSSRISELPEPV